MVHFAFRLEDGDRKRLRAVAKQLKVSPSALARQVLLDYLAQLALATAPQPPQNGAR